MEIAFVSCQSFDNTAIIESFVQRRKQKPSGLARARGTVYRTWYGTHFIVYIYIDTSYIGSCYHVTITAEILNH